MCSLHFTTEDPPGDPTADKSFALLSDFLQPDSTLTLDSTARSIENLLPENDPLSTKVWGFGETCIEVAEQIPYHHPSHFKLAELLEYLAKSPKLGNTYTSKGTPGQYIRYQRLGESLRDSLNGPDPEKPLNYVNFHAFAANLFERRITSTSPLWAIWAHRDAHEGLKPYEEDDAIPTDIYILSAAQWIFWYGQSLFKQLLYSGEVSAEDLRMWAPGRLYHGSAHLTLDRWHFWRDGYNAVASSGKDEEEKEKKKKGYSQECKEVAAKAAAMMDALEKNMTF